MTHGKIVQIFVAGGVEIDTHTLYALDEDGKIWIRPAERGYCDELDKEVWHEVEANRPPG